MIGRRRDLSEWSWTAEDAPKPGDYGEQPDGEWYAVVPPGWMGNLSEHNVVEHEDGAITVSPSILVEHWDGRSWHGYLEHGAWREL